jgi:hypothetical protein
MANSMNMRFEVDATQGTTSSTGSAGSPAASRTTAKFIRACAIQLLTIFLMLAGALIH